MGAPQSVVNTTDKAVLVLTVQHHTSEWKKRGLYNFDPIFDRPCFSRLMCGLPAWRSFRMCVRVLYDTALKIQDTPRKATTSTQHGGDHFQSKMAARSIKQTHVTLGQNVVVIKCTFSGRGQRDRRPAEARAHNQRHTAAHREIATRGQVDRSPCFCAVNGSTNGGNRQPTPPIER